MSNPYILLAKREGIAFSQYRGRAIRLSNIQPCSVDEVVVALKHNKSKINKVTTFRDEDGNIIERSFDFWHKDVIKNNLYKTSEHILNDFEKVKATAIRTFSLMKNIKHVYREYESQFNAIGKPEILWTNNSSQMHYVSKNMRTGDVIHTQTSMENISTPRSAKCSFVQYESKNEPEKSLSFKVNLLNDKISNVSTKNTKLPKNDTFLKFRAIDINTSKEMVCNYFIKQQNLEKLKLKVDTSRKLDERLIALYDDENGAINFNKDYDFRSKHNLVKAARHEVEHAWQWFLHARNTGGSNPRAMELAKKFGRIRKGKLQEIADKCTRSISTYVPYSENTAAYRKNWVEKAANKAGMKAVSAYDKQGTCLRKQFPHIPRELF